MMKFCSLNDTISNPWIKNGINHCFLETIPLIIYFGILLIFGIPLIIVQYKRRIISNERKEKSIFFCLQLIFMIMMPCLAIIRIILQNFILYDRVIYGYMISSVIGINLSYLISFVLYFQDRNYNLNNVQYGRHCMVLNCFWILIFINENLSFSSLNSDNWWWKLKSNSDKVEFSFWVIRYILTFSILILGINAPAMKKLENINFRYYNILNVSEDLTLSASSNSLWNKVIRKVKLVCDSTWPKDSYILQFKVVICILILIIGRILNVYTPIAYKYVVDSLTLSGNKSVSVYETYDNKILLKELLNPSKISFRNSFNKLVYRWDLILIFVLLRLLQGTGAGSSGILNSLRTQLWIRVQQYSSLRISVHLFAHLHSLSLRWHLSKKTGEVLRIMDRGTDSLQNILNYILFNIAPTLVDILIGIIYFASAFNSYFALIVFGTMILYLAGTVIVTEWRTKYRRIMNQLDNNKNATAVDSLINFETVKYYGAETYEVKKYRNAISEFQNYEWLSLTSLNVLNFVQNLIINVGFLGGALLCAFYIVNQKEFTVGDFVLYCTYIIQLNAPLNFFGTYYRMIQQNFIDMENMFDLLEINQEVQDSLTSQSLFIRKGEIEFKNVCFGYCPDKRILNDISFKIPQGQTYALVGNSGGGKSTIIRLIFRFYDVETGEIIIDGQNICELTQASVRQSIGVVPQDTVLFNLNIRENIRYGRLNATDNEVEDAAKAADIHERILTFPDKYNTIVGERGLKLSGGEKQRVAIARTLLKAPKIILLDEATAALDTNAERNIQASLNKISVNKTCLVVAHRLSTIVDADQILVINDGEIKERGTHSDLLNLESGLYANLWKQQLSSHEQNANLVNI